MTMYLYGLNAQMNVRRLNSIMRGIGASVAPEGAEFTIERRRRYGRTTYVYGFESPVRSSLVGHHVVGSGEIALAVPHSAAGKPDRFSRARIEMHGRVFSSGRVISIETPAFTIGGCAFDRCRSCDLYPAGQEAHNLTEPRPYAEPNIMVGYAL